jgi:hypothetical protein
MTKLMLSTIALLITGCADNPDPIKMTPPTATCSASLHQASLSYELVNGQLRLSAPGQPTTLLKRDASNASATTVLGVWDLGDPVTNGVVTVKGQLDVEKNRVSSIADCQSAGRSTMATATSAAFVDDRTITIKEDSSESLSF